VPGEKNGGFSENLLHFRRPGAWIPAALLPRVISFSSMRFLKPLYAQVLLGILLGTALGLVSPAFAVQLKPFADGFVALVKMLIAPIIFCTVVVGIAGMSDLKQAGRIGLRAVFYFEAVTTLALAIGLWVANLVQPGAGMHVSAESLDPTATAAYANTASAQTAVEFLLHIIPKTFFSAFAEGDTLQVLLLAVLFGLALGRLGEHAHPVLNLINAMSRVFFGMVAMVTRLAPVAAAGAMAFTLGRYGASTLLHLGKLMACVYLTCALFVFVCLGLVTRLAGLRLVPILRLIREELLIVVGTSSSETALPGVMEKLVSAGCARSTVGIVIPSGYSFNLDGTCIYLTMAALFIAQALDLPFPLERQLALLGVLLITSKGAAGVTGSGFITLAATLSVSGTIPVAGIALLLGVDRFLSEARAVTNCIGNVVATFIVARWNGELDASLARKHGLLRD
jgi:aerobic C4-dicarboxylate transport protein